MNDAELTVSDQAQDRLAEDAKDLSWRIKTTAGARFNAAERLRAREKRVNILSAVASAAVIFLSVVSGTVRPEGVIGVTLLLVTILASILILVTALIQFASNDGVNGERMHLCGLALGALRRRILYAEIRTRADLRTFADEYDDILSRYPNHESADYQRYRDEHPDEFKDPRHGVGPGGVRPERAVSVAWAFVTILIGVLSVAVSFAALYPGFLAWLEGK